MGTNRLFISALLVVAIGVFAVGCDSGSASSEGNTGAVTGNSSDGNDGTGIGTTPGLTGTPPEPCDGILEGDYIIETTADIDALAGYCEITGDLTISETALTSFALPALRTVGGDLSVGEYAAGGNPALTLFELPALTSVGGNLYVAHNDALSSFFLPALKTVGSDLWVADNAFLLNFSFPDLTSVGGNFWVGHQDFRGNDALAAFSLPALTSVGGDLRLEHNDAFSLFGFTVLTLVGGALMMHDNDGMNLNLTSFPALKTVGGDVLVYNNANLAQCSVDALVEQIQAGGGIGGDICFNYEYPQCLPGSSNTKTDCTCSGTMAASCPP